VQYTPPPPPPPKGGSDNTSAAPPISVAYTPAGDLPFFMTRPVTEDDLRGKSKWELDVMRNEIYARYGRTFARQDLQKYFAGKIWYSPRYAPSQFPADRLLNRLQQTNIDTILKYEQQQNMGQ
jgi:serine/threonine-protein kinase